MDREALLREWLWEESQAHIHGWDFSHIADRYEEEDDLPWDYKSVVDKYRRPEMQLLDTDTGGGEFLLSLKHPYSNTAATENYPPNAILCAQRLTPLGIRFARADAKKLPFPDGSFDLAINRHGDFCPEELRRVLRPGGIFVTQQVGAENDRELVRLLLGDAQPLPFPNQYLAIARASFENAGFRVLEQDEAYGTIQFRDVSALVWFAHIIAWEFPGFDVRSCLPNLYKAQALLEKDGVIRGRTHRFLLAAQKPV